MKTKISHASKTAYKRQKIRLSMLAALICNSVIACSVSADEIWKEDFNSPEIDGKGAIFDQLDLANVTKWSIDVSSAALTANSDWFKVSNGMFEGRDLDGVAIWQSESIAISNFQDVTITVNASENGTHESTDFIDLSYSVDGGDFQTVINWQGKGDNEHTVIDDFTAETISTTVANGSSLVVRVSMKNNAGTEYLRFDDVTVTGTIAAGGGGEVETITNACFNCPDLSKVANIVDFNDAIYYADVYSAISSSSSSDAIKNAINGAISVNHTTLTYSEVWTALTQTDEDPVNSDNVILLYKGTSLAKFSNGSGTQSSDPDNWNREHVWAKSHGFPSSSASAYTDIHHLRPTDISVNSSRGNLDFDNSDSALTEAPANRVDGDSFEPRDAVKGDVARMTFYMDTRYEGADPQTPDLTLVNMLTTTGEAKLGKLCALLAWHEADPVDEFEQSRNNKIYEFQGNRNPFIDHPEWVTQVFTQDCSNTGGEDPGNGETPVVDGELFFSEYVEGSSYNKAVEIFNPTTSTVSLAGYQFRLYGNGSSTPTATFDLTGEVLANDVLVLVSSQVTSDSALKPYADVLTSTINFNGDDYFELAKDGIVVDSFGVQGERTTWGSNVTLVRKATITAGDTNVADAFSVATEWDSYASNTFNFLGSHTFDGGAVVEPEPSFIGQCSDTADFIFDIQGTDSASTVVGENKIIEGVVTSVVDSLSGFFVQEEASDSDNNAASSDAIFVYLNGQTIIPTEGNLVRVKGDISEFYNRTQLSLTEEILDCGVGSAIPATEITLPVSNAGTMEALEGMMISIPQKLYVTDTYNLARYGQFTVSNGRLIIPTNIYNAGSAQAIALADKNARNKIVIDDKNGAQNPDNIPFPNAGLSYANTLRLGDSVESINGILDYSFNEYRVLPTYAPTFTAENVRTSSPTLNSDSEITVASFNVLNYFNGDGQGGGFPTARGADTLEEFTRQSNKIVASIADINADVVGLMEIENDGFGAESAISDLTEKLNAVMGANTYQFVSLPSATLGSDAITVGMLYKPSAVSLAGTTVTTDATPFDFGNRQPLVQSFTSLSSGEAFTVAVNHFKSKGSCSSASGGNVDQNDGQGCWNELRTQAASQLSTWLNTQPTGVDTNNILIIGDLNAYGKEDPINTFTSNGYRNLLAEKIGLSAYSYAFGGEIGYLDHALASNELTAFIDEVHEWHINADEPRAFDYNLENKSTNQITSYYGSDAYRASDHDPVVVSFTFQTQEVMYGDFDNDADIDRNDVTLFSRRLRAGEAFDSNYDFNNDSVVNSSDARALMNLCTRARCATE